MNKENNILNLFFNESSRHWHFEEILKQAKISRDKANKWLIKFQKEKLIKRIREKGKMPYYIADFETPAYKNRKRLFALEQFYKTGFLNHLMELKDTKTVILFGSFARSDWHSGSDIDLFMLGKADDFNQKTYEKKLKREIQTFIYKETDKIGKGLLRSISAGYIIKGNLNA